MENNDFICTLRHISAMFLYYPVHNNIHGLWAGWSGVRVPATVGNFLFTTVSRPALGPTQTLIQRVPGDLSLGGGIKRPGYWIWPVTSFWCIGQEYEDLYLHSTNTPPWRGAQLKKWQGQHDIHHNALYNTLKYLYMKILQYVKFHGTLYIVQLDRNPKFHYRIYKSPSLGPILRQMKTYPR
jgi:hypothetical protein